MMRTKGFTLVELMLVVAILGILGALAMPVYQGHAAEAKSSAAKSNLHAMRTQVELYKMQHEGFYPGYVNGSSVPVSYARRQLEGTSAADGTASTSKIPSGIYVYGPYFLRIPENPFNNNDSIAYSADFAADAGVVDSGWLYNYTTGQICLNKSLTDEEGVAYIDY